MHTAGSSPSAQEIWKWTFTKDAIAPCFVRDVFSMREPSGKEFDFFWLGTTPCRSVLIVAMVVAVQIYEKRTMYTIDDGTGVIDCVLRHPAPVKLDSNGTGPSSPKKPKLLVDSLEPPAPPISVATPGYPVRVTGKMVRHYDSRQIIAESIEPCASALDEAIHWSRVVDLHKSKYSLEIPFVIPPSTSIGHVLSETENTNVFATSTKPPDPLQPYNLVPPRVPPQKPWNQSSCIPITNISSASTSRVPLSPTASSVISSTPSSPAKRTSPTKDCYPPTKPKLRHPSKLHSRDLTSNTFRLYLKHYMDNASVDLNSAIDLSKNRLEIQATSSEDKTPTKRRIGDFDQQTPRPLSCINASDESVPRASLESSPTFGFTLSHLRRVPELALLASRVVRAEARRREKAEKVEASERTKATTDSKSHNGAVPFLNRSNSVRTQVSKQNSAQAGDPYCAKMKRLFGWALVRLYEEGSIVLWDGPMHPLPMPLSEPENSLWSTGESSTISSISVSASASLFSSAATNPSAHQDAANGYLSDPQPNEEAYVPLTPELLSTYVRDAVISLKRGRGKQRGGRASKEGGAGREPTAEAIVAYLHRTDARWARVGVWAVEEALEALHH